MKSKSQYFNEYDAIHRHPANKVTHYVGIPMIVVGVFGLLARLSLGSVADLGFLLWVFSSVFYFRLDKILGGSFALLMLGVYFVARMTPVAWLVVLFAVGWVFQLVGHYKYEKKSPAFLDNLLHLLIGPFWIFAKLRK